MPKFTDIGLEGMSKQEWEPDGMPLGITDEDDPRSGKIQFRIKTNWLRLSQEMLQDPQSPYFGVFKTPSDLWRHIVIRGLIAMGEKSPASKPDVVALRLKEHALMRTAQKRTRRARVDDATETVIKQVDDDVRAGDMVSAGEYLDGHLQSVMDLKEGDAIREYGLALFNHTSFTALRKNTGLRDKSKLLSTVEEICGI